MTRKPTPSEKYSFEECPHCDQQWTCPSCSEAIANDRNPEVQRLRNRISHLEAVYRADGGHSDR